MTPKSRSRVLSAVAVAILTLLAFSFGSFGTHPVAASAGTSPSATSHALPSLSQNPALLGTGAPSLDNPFSSVPWTHLQTLSDPLASVTVLTYQQAVLRAEAAAAGFDGDSWEVSFGVGVAQPYSISAILTNESFGACPTQFVSTLPTPFVITGTPSDAPLGTSAFTEFFLETPSNPNLALFVVVDNGTAYLFYTVAPYTYSVNGGFSSESCGPMWTLPSQLSPSSIDSPAAVSVANGLGGSSFLAGHPGSAVVWEFLSSGLVGGPDGYLHPRPPIWVVQYETVASCGFFGGSGIGSSFGVDIDASTGAGLYAGSESCTSEYPISFTETGLPASTVWSVQLSSGDSNASNGNSLMLEATNGTVAYAITGIAGYAATPAGGSVDINGAGMSVSITFSTATTYLVTFNETGVTPGVGWSAELNGTLFSTFGSTLSFVTTAGTFPYEVGGALGIDTITPDSGSVTVTSTNIAVSLSFTAVPMYLVTVLEAGLPAGTLWGAGFEANYVDTQNVTTNGSFSLLLANGSYDFGGASILADYNTSAGGVVTVAGAPVTEEIVFAPRATYSVTFSAEGLPGGIPWAIGIYGFEVANSSASGSIGFIEPNLTLYFDVGPVAGYSPSPALGSVTVDGTSLTETIVFGPNDSQPLYPASFSESNLPGGTNWTVTVGATTLAMVGSTIQFNLTNGSYAYAIGSVSGFAASPSSGELSVNGGPVSEAISFSPVATVTYTVTFDERGLPTGTNWSVLLDGTLSYSTSTSVSFAEPNGSYTFSIGAADGYLPTPASGPIVVTGAPLSEPVAFALPPATQYEVMFSETGLSSGTSWGVALGSFENTSSTSTVGFSVDNGSYFFVIGTISGYTVAPVNGTIVVSGVPVTKAVVFTALPPGEFSVVFTESGLPDGTEWTVSLAGNYNSSTTATIGFVVHNGSYPYTIESVSGYSTTPATGTANVTGKSISVSVTFSPSSASSASPKFLGLPATEGYALLGAIVLVIVAAIVALARRGRKGSGSSPPPAPPAGSGGPPPGGTA